MDALSLTGAQVAARIAVLDQVTAFMGDVAVITTRIADHVGSPKVALGELAIAARVAWTGSQIALAQSEMGYPCRHLIEALAARTPGTPSTFGRLVGSTKAMVERRLAWAGCDR